MFGHILVATDLTPVTRVSLRAALDLARHDQGEVLLVHIIRRIPGIPDRELRDFYDRLKTDAQRRMHELTSGFNRERGVEIACEIAVGHPSQEIVRIARKRGADLVVLAHAKGHGQAPLGSVSYKVAHLATCAVLLLKEPASTSTSTRVRRRAPARRAG
jgi:nucleotide-binding universal stress UspA family protein